MTATQAPGALRQPGASVVPRDPSARDQPARDDPRVNGVAWVALRTATLVAIVVLLVQVALPAVLGAAGSQLASIH